MHVQICSFAIALSLPILTSCLSSSSVADRRTFLLTSAAGGILSLPTPAASAKCTDIDSCRETGDQKVAQDLKDTPVTILPDGTRYKQLKAGFGDGHVRPSSTVDLIYTISRAGGRYMYSQGFGFEKIDVGNGLQNDLGLDSYRVTLGKGYLPVGIEDVLVGMKKGERRRVELPPSVGFETSDWKPQPRSNLGKASVVAYQKILKGFGSQPPFPATTIWDVEVLSFRN
jgi:FKBP-type peptidyl-prolyl cis-trans isomerase